LRSTDRGGSLDETLGEEEYERTVGEEEGSLVFELESEERICRGELETEPDVSVLDRSDPVVDFSAGLLEDG
jgi:hypothetical protein